MGYHWYSAKKYGVEWEEKLQVICRAEPLTQEAFEPFGQVLQHHGTARRHELRGVFADHVDGARPAIWVSRLLEASSLPAAIDRLERHPFSDQVFVPLVRQPYLVVTCRSGTDGTPDLATIRAFLAAPTQGLIYRRNIWHCGLTVLAAPAEFVVVMGRLEGAEDDVFLTLATPITIVAE